MRKIFLFPKRFFKAKIPISVAVIIFSAFCIILFFGSGLHKEKIKIIPVSQPCDQTINFIRIPGHELTRPVLVTRMQSQSEVLAPIKAEIQSYINKENVNDTFKLSMYLLKQSTGDWIGINDEVKHNTTGYIRLAMLITYLKMSESDPSVLNKRLWYPQPLENRPKSDSLFSLTPGQYYSVRDLLKYMMLYPDTNSKSLLTANLNSKIFENLFSQLGLAKPDFANRKFPITVRDYSLFLQVIYNARYLNETNSEYALQMLSDEKVRRGILKFLPANAKAIHKLSERYNNNEFELRESGIIYNDNDSYLLTIFANGDNMETLDSTAGTIAKIVYDHINVNQ